MVGMATRMMRMGRIFADFCFVFVLVWIFVVGCNGEGENVAVETETTVSGDPVNGEALFNTTCFACHGIDATGLPGQGKDLTTSGFTRGLTDAQFVDFVKIGRDITDPLNTSGSDMPPYGGNPTFTEQDLFDIVAYIRTLEK